MESMLQLSNTPSNNYMGKIINYHYGQELTL